MKRFLISFLAVLLLVSCGAPADTTADNATDEPTVTDSPETQAPEVNMPEDNTPDEPSPYKGISPIGGTMYKINFENGHSVEVDAASAEKVFEEIKAKGYMGTLVGMLSSSAFEIEKCCGRYWRKGKGKSD